MRHRVTSALVLLLCVLFHSGCNIVDTTEKFFNSRPPDYADGTEITDDKWMETAGKDGRGNRGREVDPDPWWGRLVMSKKARDIEGNLGIDH